MKYKNYCIVVMGEKGTIKDEILKMSEGQPRYIDAKGILLGTFMSPTSITTLERFFKTEGRSFFLFEVDKSVAGYHMDNPQYHKHLFGYLNGMDLNMGEKMDMLEGHISATTKDNVVTTKKPKYKNTIFTKEILEDMTITEREKLMNGILDKGTDNLTKTDKKLLKMISEID